MKTRTAKITIWLIIVLLAVGLTWTITQKAEAGTVSSQTFVLPSSSSVTHTANTYLVIWDKATGDMALAATGVVAAANDWTDCDIATAQHAQNTAVWTATIPALDTKYVYIMAVFDNATPADDDVPTAGPFIYDPSRNQTYTDTNPQR